MKRWTVQDEEIVQRVMQERRITQHQHSELILFIKDAVKKHEDYMELIKQITGHDIEYSKGSIDAYNSVLNFISRK